MGLELYLVLLPPRLLYALETSLNVISKEEEGLHAKQRDSSTLTTYFVLQSANSSEIS